MLIQCEFFNSDNFKIPSLSKILISNCSFLDIDFTDYDLSEAEIVGCSFDSCDFNNTNLSGTIFERCLIADCRFGKINTETLTIFDCCHIYHNSFIDDLLPEWYMLNCRVCLIEQNYNTMEKVCCKRTSYGLHGERSCGDFNKVLSPKYVVKGWPDANR